MARRYLQVPFTQKDQAKALGARWDALARSWYLPEGLDESLFAAWLPAAQPEPEGSTSVVMVDPSQPSDTSLACSLSALLEQVGGVIRREFALPVWVKAEITEVSERQGNYYLVLAESVNGTQVAQARAMIWRQQASELLVRFQSVTGSMPQAGQAVLVQVQVSLHSRFGLGLTITDLDPAYTLGDQQAKLEAIRRSLRAEGLFDRNQRLPRPLDFCRVAVLSPAQAAGLGDFRADAARLVAHGLCEFVYVHASFQGSRTQAEMCAALQQIAKMHQQTPFDALVIIRGGGAKADLLSLNDEAIARALLALPLPVMTGIGHERDSTLLDELANWRLDTPSKVVAAIVQQITHQSLQAARHWQQLQADSHRRVEQARAQIQGWQRQLTQQCSHQITQARRALESRQQQMRQGARLSLTVQAQHLKHQVVRLKQQALQQLQHQRRSTAQWHQQMAIQARQPLIQARRQLNRHHQLLPSLIRGALVRAQRQLAQQHRLILAHHPERLLRLGYVLVRDEQQQVITRAEQAISHKRLRLHFRDGQIEVQPIKPRTPSSEQSPSQQESLL